MLFVLSRSNRSPERTDGARGLATRRAIGVAVHKHGLCYLVGLILRLRRARHNMYEFSSHLGAVNEFIRLA